MVKDGDGEQYFATACCVFVVAKDERKLDGPDHIIFMINKQNLDTELGSLKAMFW